MSDSPFALSEPTLLCRLIAEQLGIWQLSFLDATGMETRAKVKGISLFNRNTINKLWQIGLLRADFVVSPNRFHLEGLVEIVGQSLFEQYVYADIRSIPNREDGWNNALTDLPDLSAEITPYFHPFRIFVLQHLTQTFNLASVSPILVLAEDNKFLEAMQRGISEFKNGTSSPHFLQKVTHINDLVSLVVLAEPWAYEHVFHVRGYPLEHDDESWREVVSAHINKVADVFRTIGLENIEQGRKKLRDTAYLLDRNTKVHTILRLTRSDDRLDLGGQLGAAIYLLSMAEILRRTTETVFSVELPEEYETGYRPGAKLETYGAERILDHPGAASSFLRLQGLDYGVSVRWYVEGDTELGAIQWALAGASKIELINLRG